MESNTRTRWCATWKYHLEYRHKQIILQQCQGNKNKLKPKRKLRIQIKTNLENFEFNSLQSKLNMDLLKSTQKGKYQDPQIETEKKKSNKIQ